MTATDRPPRPLGELLLSAGLVREQALEDAAARQPESGLRIGEQLVRDGAVSEADLAVILSFQLGVPLVAVAREHVDDGALALVPEAFARDRHVLPLRADGAQLHVAMADPADDATR
ncbi:MAG: GspE/PulE/PilB domain-containing protein, partial [Candidatus Limnocylindria bacterium]